MIAGVVALGIGLGRDRRTAAGERFIDWSATGGGSAGLGALGRALEAGQAAADALTTFGHSLEATTCPG